MISKEKKIKVAILGASGYLGGELLRLLLPHGGVEVTEVVSGSNTGKKVAELHPHLAGACDLSFSSSTPARLAKKNGALFFALPHGVSQDAVAEAREASDGCKLIDLSGDFRLPDADAYQRYYKVVHKHPKLLAEAVYGLPELPGQRAKIKAAKLIASPGCFSTTSILTVLPFAAAGLIDLRMPLIVDAATGSSGSGTHPSANTHHPTRANNFKAYEIFTHRHTPEIEEYVPGHPSVVFTPHSGPWVRGIFATAYVPLKKEMSADEAQALVVKHYAGEFFIRPVAQVHVAQVAHTNFVQVSASANGRGAADGGSGASSARQPMAIVTAALDNLVKGGAGQAVQSFNIAFGLPEKQGLEALAIYP